MLKTKQWSTDDHWVILPNEGEKQIGDRFLTVNFDWTTNDMELVKPNWKDRELMPFKKRNLMVKTKGSVILVYSTFVGFKL